MLTRFRHSVALVLTSLVAPGLCAAAWANSPPAVTNVVAQQIAGTGNVRVTFNVSDADGDQVTARVICSSDNGVTFDLLPVTVSGDVHRPMAPGTGKEILWDAARDYPGRFWGQVVAKVVVTDGPVSAGEMVFVAGGAFLMGSTSGQPDEQPQHSVNLDPFYIDKYEVTNAEYQVFIDAGGYSNQAFWSVPGWNIRQAYNWTAPVYWPEGAYNSGPGYPGFPVSGVSWYEAEAYANFVGKRLPSEAEWEKAARGADTRPYPWGNQPPTPDRANYSGSGDPFPYSTPVGFYNGQAFPNPPFQTTDSPGAYGTYDQAGNVWEWVRDWYKPDYYSDGASNSNNPTGPLTGAYKVTRGGSWDYNYYAPAAAENLRLARRTISHYNGGESFTSSPEQRRVALGFRCARSGP